MTTTTEPAVLFRVPDDVGRRLPRAVRSFVLRDDPEDTQAAIAAHDVLQQLDAEAGSLLRYRLQNGDDDGYHLRAAEEIAAVAGDLQKALRDLDARWSKQDQDLNLQPVKDGGVT